MTTTANPDRLDDDDEAQPEAEATAPTTIALRSPSVPITIAELAALREETAVSIITARNRTLQTMVAYAIGLTHPADWTAYKAPDGAIRCYLGDDGCARVRPFFGISIFNVSAPMRIDEADGSFMYFVTCDARCALTGQSVEQIEGGRSSTEKFCDGKTGAELHRLVRKAARANANGTATRELAGLESFPMDAIARHWHGTGKSVDDITKGRGFGTQAERFGGNPERGAPDVPPPTCGVCGAVGRFISGARGGFYGCPDLNKHRDRKWTQDAKAWEAKVLADRAKADARPCSICQKTKAEHTDADHDYE